MDAAGRRIGKGRGVLAGHRGHDHLGPDKDPTWGGDERLVFVRLLLVSQILHADGRFAFFVVRRNTFFVVARQFDGVAVDECRELR